MDALFKALNDPARRALLDSLRAKDGQTLTELETQLDMTRFGVMKHLKVLEDAHLVIPRKVGRFKYHYLNVVPLAEVMDRWIEPLLARPAARAMIDLKTRLEGLTMTKPSVMGPVQSMVNIQQKAPSRLSASRAWLGGTDKSWRSPALALSIPFHRL